MPMRTFQFISPLALSESLLLLAGTVLLVSLRDLAALRDRGNGHFPPPTSVIRRARVRRVDHDDLRAACVARLAHCALQVCDRGGVDRLGAEAARMGSEIDAHV